MALAARAAAALNDKLSVVCRARCLHLRPSFAQPYNCAKVPIAKDNVSSTQFGYPFSWVDTSGVDISQQSPLEAVGCSQIALQVWHRASLTILAGVVVTVC